MVGNYGGRREGAGRPKQEETKVLRVPLSKVELIKGILNPKTANTSLGEGVDKLFGFERRLTQSLTLFSSAVQAGFPSPGDDHADKKLDLNEHLVAHPESTFFARVSGESMVNAGLFPGDILVVDRSITPKNGQIIVAVLNQEMTVKRYFKEKGGIQLYPENPDYPTLEVTKESEFQVWGVVVHSIRNLE